MEERVRSADQVLNIVCNDPEVLKALKENPEGELQKLVKKAKEQIPGPAYLYDKWVYRTVVAVLGVVAVLAAIGAILLGPGKEAPQLLVALGSAAIGALAGLLAPSPSGK